MTDTVASMNQEGFQPDAQKILNIIKSVGSDPKLGWEIVKNEYSSSKSLYLNFVLPVISVVAICNIIKLNILGTSVPYLGTIKLPLETALISSIGLMIQQSVMLFIGAQILTKLAPSFDGATDDLRAMKLIAFTLGVGSIASVGLIIPYVGYLIALVVSIYSLYVFYCGVTVMTGVPANKKLVYTIVAIICTAVVGFIINMIFAAIGIY